MDRELQVWSALKGLFKGLRPQHHEAHPDRILTVLDGQRGHKPRQVGDLLGGGLFEFDANSKTVSVLHDGKVARVMGWRELRDLALRETSQ